MAIAVDAMGGDRPLTVQVEAAVRTVKDFGIEVIIVGAETQINQQLKQYSFDQQKLRVVNSTEIVEMEESPATALRQKKDSSIRVAVDLVKAGEADAVVSKFDLSLDEWTEISEGPDSKFVGYDIFRTDSKIRRFSLNGQGQLQFILDITPFYAESGGQVGDQGTLEQNGKKWNVVDVQKQGDSIDIKSRPLKVTFPDDAG